MGMTKAPTRASPTVTASPRQEVSPSAKEMIVYEGLLKYQSKHGKWKERWFMLDKAQSRLVKTKLHGGSVVRKPVGVGVHITDIRGLSTAERKGDSSSSSSDNEAGLEVVTSTGQHLRYLTSSRDEEERWLGAAQGLSHGFTSVITGRLAERELLAGKYALVRELGRGASGIVYLYTYRGQPYAVKKFVPQKAKGIPNRLAVPGAGATGARPGGLARPGAPPTTVTGKGAEIPEDVRREIALLKKASHLPYVIKLHDVIANTEEQQFYLVMEYMGGGAIAEWDAERKSYGRARNQKSLSLLDEKTVRVYMTNLLLGIQALHQNGLCHRDIKPENLMANEDGTMCKIGDLGIAHYFHEDANGGLVEEVNPENIELWDITKDTQSPDKRESSEKAYTRQESAQCTAPPRKAMLNSTKGTYQFLPPEALTGDDFDGFKADIWSIGVTLYVLLFGYLPFFSTDLVVLFEKIERDPVVIPASCRDEEVKDLLLRILEKDPEKRISIEQILEHSWMHRHVNSRALTQQVQALKRAPRLVVDAIELGAAVSVLQSRFDQLSRAVRDNSLGELRANGFLNASQVDNKAPYVPRPITTSEIALPAWMESDLHVVATQLHFDWCRAKHLEGWTHGAVRDDGARVHPLLVPMRDLPDDARLKNVECAEQTLKCVLALGCHVGKQPSRTAKRCRAGPGGLVPADQVALTWDMLLLVDLLAENSHEVWAASYVEQGWRYGPVFDADAKTHPSLKPYMALDEEDKNLCREGVGAVLKSCVCLGYTVSCARDKPSPRRSDARCYLL